MQLLVKVESQVSLNESIANGPKIRKSGKSTEFYGKLNNSNVNEESPIGVVFARMSLNPGVSAMNVFTMMWVVFAVRLVLSFAVSFMTTLIIEDYKVSPTQAGKVAGNLGFYASIASVFAELAMGSIMDTFGRKWASIIGMTLAGTALGLMPIGAFNVFPYLYTMRIL